MDTVRTTSDGLYQPLGGHPKSPAGATWSFMARLQPKSPPSGYRVLALEGRARGRCDTQIHCYRWSYHQRRRCRHRCLFQYRCYHSNYRSTFGLTPVACFQTTNYPHLRSLSLLCRTDYFYYNSHTYDPTLCCTVATDFAYDVFLSNLLWKFPHSLNLLHNIFTSGR